MIGCLDDYLESSDLLITSIYSLGDYHFYGFL